MKKQVKYDTFCGDDCKGGVNLAKVLNEIGDDVLTRKVLSKIHGFYDKVNDLKNLKKYYVYFLQDTMEFYKKNVDDSSFPIVVKTHLTNLFVAVYRKKLKEFRNGRK